MCSSDLHTDRRTCNFCSNSMTGYAKMLNLDSVEVYDPSGFVGRWTQAGRVA